MSLVMLADVVRRLEGSKAAREPRCPHNAALLVDRIECLRGRALHAQQPFRAFRPGVRYVLVRIVGCRARGGSILLVLEQVAQVLRE